MPGRRRHAGHSTESTVPPPSRVHDRFHFCTVKGAGTLPTTLERPTAPSRPLVRNRKQSTVGLPGSSCSPNKRWGILAQPFLEGVLRLELRHPNAVDGRPRVAHLLDFLLAHFPNPQDPSPL